MRAMILLPLACLLFSCGSRFTEADGRAIHQVMHAQEQAWNQADIAGFMIGYSDTICFIATRGQTCGKGEVERMYRRSYQDAAAMGRLTFRIGELLPVGGDHAWLTGAWELARASDTLSGGYSLLWAREGRHWRIVRDHSY